MSTAILSRRSLYKSVPPSRGGFLGPSYKLAPERSAGSTTHVFDPGRRRGFLDSPLSWDWRIITSFMISASRWE